MKQFPVITSAAAVLLLAGSASVMAQTTDTSVVGQVAQYATDKLKTELNLTPEQVPKVQKANLESAKAMQALLAKYTNDTSAAASAALAKGMVANIRSNQSALKQILTPAQWATHQQNKAERLAMSQTETMAAELGLSKSQILDVNRINMESSRKLVAALDKPLSGSKPTHAAIMEAAKPTMDQRDSALSKVLRADQWEKMKSKRMALRQLFVDQASASPTPSAAAAAPKPKP